MTRLGGGRVPLATPRRSVDCGRRRRSRRGPCRRRRGSPSLAARGHEVTVYERRDRAGGHLADLATLPTRDGWAKAVEDLLAELARSGAALRLGTEVDRALVDRESPDLVLLATGAEWEVDRRHRRRPRRHRAVETTRRIATVTLHTPGAAPVSARPRRGDRASPRVDPSRLGRSVLIADDTGTYAPLGLAEALATAGASVRFLTARNEIGTEPSFHLELPAPAAAPARPRRRPRHRPRRHRRRRDDGSSSPTSGAARPSASPTSTPSSSPCAGAPATASPPSSPAPRPNC